jgi:hypothetical protein
VPPLDVGAESGVKDCQGRGQRRRPSLSDRPVVGGGPAATGSTEGKEEAEPKPAGDQSDSAT